MNTNTQKPSNAMKTKKVANIHQDLTGKWFITDDSLNYLTTDGTPFSSSRQAIQYARESGEWTHYRTGKKPVKL